MPVVQWYRTEWFWVSVSISVSFGDYASPFMLAFVEVRASAGESFEFVYVGLGPVSRVS